VVCVVVELVVVDVEVVVVVDVDVEVADPELVTLTQTPFRYCPEAQSLR
jgi:hypothetical protein